MRSVWGNSHFALKHFRRCKLTSVVQRGTFTYNFRTTMATNLLYRVFRISLTTIVRAMHHLAFSVRKDPLASALLTSVVTVVLLHSGLVFSALHFIIIWVDPFYSIFKFIFYFIALTISILSIIPRLAVWAIKHTLTSVAAYRNNTKLRRIDFILAFLGFYRDPLLPRGAPINPPPRYGLFSLSYVPPVAFAAQRTHHMYLWWARHHYTGISIIFSYIITILTVHALYFLVYHSDYFSPACNPVLPLVRKYLYDEYLANNYNATTRSIPIAARLTWLATKEAYSCTWVDLTYDFLRSGILWSFVIGAVSYLCLLVKVDREADNLLAVVHDTPLSDSFLRLAVFNGSPINFRESAPTMLKNLADARVTIDSFIRTRGYEPYCPQLREQDVENNIDGTMKYINGRDLTGIEQQRSTLADTHILRIVDDDYDIEWTRILWMCKPVMVYTFTPSQPCGVDPEQEYTWTTQKDNSILFTTRGGTRRVKKLWNYNVPLITQTYPGFRVTYKVTQLHNLPNWSYILINPVSVISTNVYITNVPPFTRRQLVYSITNMSGGTSVAAIMEIEGTGIQRVSIPGHYASISITPSMRAMLMAKIASGVAKRMGDILFLLSEEYKEHTSTAQAILFLAFPICGTRGSLASDPKDADIALTYTKLPTKLVNLDPPEKFPVTRLSPPIIPTGIVPSKTPDNERWTKWYRLEEKRNDQQVFPPKFDVYGAEFMAKLIPIPHTATVHTVSSIMESRTLPAQRANDGKALENLFYWWIQAKSVVAAFQKDEIYSAIKGPRNISTLPAEQCLLYSQFTRGISDILKKQPWYAFGIHPNEVASRINLLANKHTKLVETDFSRFDGTHSLALYQFEMAIYKRAYPVKYHSFIERIHASMLENEAHTQSGIKYDIGGSRLSGAADTSIMNSIDNAFVAYSAYRESGHSIEAAWKMLGIYGGDDGISGDLSPELYDRVAKELGLSLKTIAKDSTKFCSFLGRIYPNPRGSACHMADLPRQLPKLHLTPTADARIRADPFIGLHNKAIGHLAMDANTPILTKWCNMVNRLVPARSKVYIAAQQSYTYSQMEDKSIGPEYTPDRETSMRVVCEMLNTDSSHIEAYEKHLDELKDIEDLEPFYDTAPVVIPAGVRVGHDSLPPVLTEGKRTGPPDDRPGVTIVPGESKEPITTLRGVCTVCQASTYLSPDAIITMRGRGIQDIRAPTKCREHRKKKQQ
jgi:hypothetical protein